MDRGTPGRRAAYRTSSMHTGKSLQRGRLSPGCPVDRFCEGSRELADGRDAREKLRTNVKGKHRTKEGLNPPTEGASWRCRDIHVRGRNLNVTSQ